MEEEQLSETYKQMKNGVGPTSPGQWKDLALYLGSIAKFNLAVNHELDAMAHALDVIEKLMEVLADAATPETAELMRKVVVDAYESQGFSVSEVQGENDGQGPDGPAEPGDGGFMSPEGEEL